MRLRRLPASGIFLLSFLVRYRRQDDDLVALLPIHRGRNFVFGSELHRIEYAQHLIKVAAGAHGIAELKFDLLIGTDHENRAYSRIVGGGAAFRGASTLGR